MSGKNEKEGRDESIFNSRKVGGRRGGGKCIPDKKNRLEARGMNEIKKS